MRKGFKSNSSSKNKLGTYTLLVAMALSGQSIAKDCDNRRDPNCEESRGSSSIFPYWLMSSSNRSSTTSSSTSSSKSSFFSSSSRGSSSFGG